MKIRAFIGLLLALLVSTCPAANIAGFLGGSPPQGGTPIDAILDIQSGSDGTPIDTTILAANTFGATGAWGIQDSISALYTTEIHVASVSRLNPLRIGGTSYQNATRGYMFNMEAAVAAQVSIASIGATNPGTINTSTPHGFTTGQRVRIQGVTGNTTNGNANGINNNWIITVTDSDTFTITGGDVTVAGTGGNCQPGFEGFNTNNSTGIIPASTEDLSITALVYLNSEADASAQSNQDILQILSGNYAILQHDVLAADSARYVKAHGQTTVTDTAGLLVPVEADTLYQVTLRHSTTDGFAQIVIQDAASGALVGASEAELTGGEITLFQTSDYLDFYGGNYQIFLLGFDWTNAALPIDQNFSVPSPTSLDLNQTGDTELTLTFVAYGLRMTIERHNGTSWSTVASNQQAYLYADTLAVGASTYVDNTVSSGTTYKYRITTSIGSYTSAVSAESNSVTVATPTWQDTFDGASSDGTESVLGSGYARVQPITLTAGTVSKLRIWIETHSTNVGMKLALYDGSDNLIANGTGTVTGTGWFEVNVSNTAVSSGAHKIAVNSDGNATDIQWGVMVSQPANTSWYNFDTSYAAFPPSTAPSNQGSITKLFAVGALIAP